MINSSKISCDITDYKELIQKGYFYCDKTSCIEFFRKNNYVSIPLKKGTGVSLFCSTIYYYYDINSLKEYDYLFKSTYIYNRFDDHNKYYVIKIDCSNYNKGNLKKSLDDFCYRYPDKTIPTFFYPFLEGIPEFSEYIDKLFIIVDNATDSIIRYIDNYLKKINSTAKVFITKPDNCGVSLLAFTSQNLLDYIKSINNENYQELTNQILDYLGYDVNYSEEKVIKVVNNKLFIEYINNYYNNDKSFTYYNELKNNLISILDKVNSYSILGSGNNYLKYLLINGEITKEKYNREIFFNYNKLPFGIKSSLDHSVSCLISNSNSMFKENVIKYHMINDHGIIYQKPEKVEYIYPKVIRNILLDYLLYIINKNSISIDNKSVNEVVIKLGQTGDISPLIKKVFKNQYEISKRINMSLDNEYIFLMIMLYFHVSDIPVDFESKDNAIIIKKNEMIKYNIIIASSITYVSKIIDELNDKSNLQIYKLNIWIDDNFFQNSYSISYSIKKYCDNKYIEVITNTLSSSEEND